MFGGDDPLSALRWLPVTNAAGEDVPPFGVVKVAGAAGDASLSVVQPDADGLDARLLLVNGPLKIPPGKVGQACRPAACMALADSGAAGDEVGTAAGAWSLTAGKSGVRLLTAVVSGKAVVNSGGGGGTSDMVAARIDGFFIRDNPLLVTSPSPNCHYPCTVMELTKAGWVATATKIWVVPFHNMASVDNGPGLPFTMFLLDGTDACWAKPTDDPDYKTYAPLDGSDPPFAFDGESRPVYETTQYAADWAVQCLSGLPKGVVG